MSITYHFYSALSKDERKELTFPIPSCSPSTEDNEEDCIVDEDTSLSSDSSEDSSDHNDQNRLDRENTDDWVFYEGDHQFVGDNWRHNDNNIDGALDMHEQRMRVAMDRQEHLREHTSRLADEAQLSSQSQELAVKLLLNEAHRKHIEKLRASTDRKPLDESDCTLAWLHLSKQAMRDFHVEGHAFTQRKLSCVCLFNPLTDERVYENNEAERFERLCRQRQTLHKLRMQAASGGSPFFLKESVSAPSDEVRKL